MKHTFDSFSFENDFSPEQFVTIKHKNNLNFVSTFGKTAWIYVLDHLV